MSRPGYYTEKIEALRRAWGGRCVSCGPERRTPLEFAHLPGKPTALGDRGRGLPNRYYDVRNHPESYVLICRDCHADLDGRGGRERGRYAT